MPSAADFEKLGVFYLGRPYDWQQKKAQDGVLLYDSKDLVTHAVCVGMTGSGKTGLCLALIEEAAIDGVPAILIDPKGDLANLLLTFPALRPEDFRPWINEDDARRKSLSPDDYAHQQAELWQKGLASWGEDGARIQRLRDAADFAIYTPGSNAGIPLSILKSFAAPPPAIRDDEELLRERIGTTATSLLGLLGIDADPIKSREHILIATILDTAWRQGQELDLAGLIQQIQTPPVKRVGVLDLEAFFPSKDRFALAMSLNNLLAAPGFGAWMEGEPLDAALPTALVGYVCRGKGEKETLRVERQLVGQSAVTFPPISLEPSGDPCAQVRDMIPAATLGTGSFQYVVTVLRGEEPLAKAQRQVVVTRAESDPAPPR